MGYGQVAEDAINHYLSTHAKNSNATMRASWQQMIQQHRIPDKSCPRATFLFLCSVGLVNNVRAGGHYNDGRIKNGIYGVVAFAILKYFRFYRPALRFNESQLWATIGAFVRRAVSYNDQMDVVLHLFYKNMLV